MTKSKTLFRYRGRERERCGKLPTQAPRCSVSIGSLQLPLGHPASAWRNPSPVTRVSLYWAPAAWNLLEECWENEQKAASSWNSRFCRVSYGRACAAPPPPPAVPGGLTVGCRPNAHSPNEAFSPDAPWAQNGSATQTSRVRASRASALSARSHRVESTQFPRWRRDRSMVSARVSATEVLCGPAPPQEDNWARCLQHPAPSPHSPQFASCGSPGPH